MQDILAILIALIAAGYLARVLWLRVKRREGGACGSCSSCSENSSPNSRPLIPVDELQSSAHALRSGATNHDAK